MFDILGSCPVLPAGHERPPRNSFVSARSRATTSDGVTDASSEFSGNRRFTAPRLFWPHRCPVSIGAVRPCTHHGERPIVPDGRPGLARQAQRPPSTAL